MNEREILDQLIIEKKIIEEDIAGASSRILTFDTKKLVDTLHTQFCNLNHDTGECGWYEETMQGDDLGDWVWKKPYHLAWTKLFRDFLSSTKLIKFIEKGVTEESSGSSNGSSLLD